MGGVETHDEESVWSVDLTADLEGGGGVTGHDQVWFEGIFRTHAPAVHRYFVRRTHVGEVDDLTAETFVVAWRRRTDVPDGAELPWLYRTAGFLLANHHRKGRPVPVDRLPDQVDHADPAHLVVVDESVRQVLASMSSRDRQVLVLNAWEGLTGDDLAAVLGISRGGADAALSRARARLREQWEKREAVEGR